MSRPPLLQMSGVTKRYGATTALDGVAFDLRAGEVHALMGENGAGKSTLMKILAGDVRRDAGRIAIDGKDVDITDPNDARDRGIAVIHQELNTVPDMSVAENLALGNEPVTRWGQLDRHAMVQDALGKLQRIGADIDSRRPLGGLSVGMQQMVEIARAVSEQARILVLDEPTAALSRSESERLYQLIDELRRDGVGLVYISHRMEEVWRLADRVTVFRDGRYVGTRHGSQVNADQIVAMMVGRPLDDLYQHDPRNPGEVALRIEDLEGPGVGPVTLEVRSGEVVCLAGLIGAGRTELVRLIFGADRPTAGRITVDGRPLKPRSPKDAIAAGIAMVPESRKDQGLFLPHTVEDNIALTSLDRFTTAGRLERRRIRTAVTDMMDRLNLRRSALRLPVKALSGGNQQKAVLARWLLRRSRVLILDEPTRGVDIGAKSEIYQTINTLTATGHAVLVVSSDLPEAIGIADRVLVMRKGGIVQELDGADATEELVMAYATGTRTATQGAHP